MTGQDDQFKQAVAAFKAGRRDEARNLLMDIVDKDERHEQAWLYLSALVETVEEQQICLENVLEISPNNDRARKGLEKVKQQIAARAPDETPAASTPQEPSMPSDMPLAVTDDDASPFSTLDWDTMPTPEDDIGAEALSQPIGAEFGGSSGDSLVGDAPTEFPAPDSFSSGSTAADETLDWLNDESTQPMFATPDQPVAAPSGPDRDPLAAATSVDWAASDAHATLGSGKDVDTPSPQEYDDWVQNLNIKNDEEPAAPEAEPAADALSSPFTDDAPGPFSGTDYMLGDETPGEPEAQAPAATDAASGGFGGDVFGSDAEPAWDSPNVGLSSGGVGDDDTAAAGGDAFADFDSSDSGLDVTEAAEPGDLFDGDSLYDETPSATDHAAPESGTGSLFDDDYGTEDEDFGSATVYEPDDALFGGDAEDDDLNFSFDEDDDSFLDEEPAKSAAETKSDKRSKKAKQAKQAKAAPAIDPAHAKYYALIPAEIEAKGGGSGRGGVMLGLLIMLALNAAGYAAYFLELI